MKLFLSSILMLIVSTSFAEPSMQETIEFIKQKTDFSYTRGSHEEGYYKVNISNCGITLINKYEYVSGSNKGVWYETKHATLDGKPIPLNKFDPTMTKIFKVRGQTNSVDLVTKQQIEIIGNYNKTNTDWSSFDDYKGKNGIWSNHSSPTKQFSMFIAVIDPKEINGPKVLKAINHLIKLCGGKGELF